MAFIFWDEGCCYISAMVSRILSTWLSSVSDFIPGMMNFSGLVIEG